MRMVARFRVNEADLAAWLPAAELALTALAQQAGFLSGEIGASTDDSDLWLLTCNWDSVGSYRRALSAYEVKRDAVALLYGALDEPTAFETIRELKDGELQRHSSARAADADWVRIREAAEPNPPSRLD